MAFLRGHSRTGYKCGFWTPLIRPYRQAGGILGATRAKCSYRHHQYVVVHTRHEGNFFTVTTCSRKRNQWCQLSQQISPATHLHRHQLIYPRPDPRRYCRRHPGLLRSFAERFGHRRQAGIVANVHVGYLWAELRESVTSFFFFLFFPPIIGLLSPAGRSQEIKQPTTPTRPFRIFRDKFNRTLHHALRYTERRVLCLGARRGSMHAYCRPKLPWFSRSPANMTCS